MGILQIISHRPQEGKTTLTAALWLALAQSGKTAAYYKPLSAQPGADSDPDPDATFMQEEVLPLQAGPPTPAPLILDPTTNLDSPQTQQMQEAVSALHSSQGRVLVDGPSLVTADGQDSPLPNQTCSALGSKAVLLFGHTPDLAPEDILQAAAPFGENLAGVVVNTVTKHRLAGFRQALTAALVSSNIRLLGVLPEMRFMRAPTLQQLVETLDGRWVQQPSDADTLMERILIGGNIMDSGPEYYGRYASQVVITRSQRPDIQLASLVPGTKCLVLTEGGEPAGYITAEAAQRKVPVMVVQSNTPETTDALVPLLTGSSPPTLAKVKELARNLPSFLDLDTLMALAG